jgi:hypothetical protein
MTQLIKRFGLRTVELGGGRTDRTRSVMYFRHRYYRAEELAEDLLCRQSTSNHNSPAA